MKKRFQLFFEHVKEWVDTDGKKDHTERTPLAYGSLDIYGARKVTVYLQY
jgi:hypothetical protein